MRSLPLTWRISLLVAVALTACVAAIEMVAYFEMVESLAKNIDRTLRAMAQAVVSETQEGLDIKELDKDVRAVTGYSAEKRSTRFRLWLEGASEDFLASDLAGSPEWEWLHRLPEASRPELDRERFLDIGRRKREYRAIWARHKVDGKVLNVLIAHDSHDADLERQEFRNLLLALGGAVVVIGGATAGLLVWLGMSPVRRMAHRLRQMTYKSLGKTSLRDENAPAELVPFIDSVEDLLQRLDYAIRRQKEFTSDASHELRTPLAAAKSSLQLARIKPRTGEEYRQAIEDALIDLGRVESLTSQLLNLARLEAVDDPESFAEIRLDEVLLAAVTRHRPRAAEKGCKLLVSLQGPVWIRGNEMELSQLLDNLLDNAIKHGPADHSIDVTMNPDDGRCEIAVHDGGGDIPADSLPRLFDRFYRVDRSRSCSTGGTGLGLAIAREIVRRHGGEIGIASSQEAGTTVRVSLPIITTPSAA